MGRYEAPPKVDPPPLESLIDEGMLIVSSGIRMAVKNQAIVSILRDGASFELQWYLDEVRAQLAAYAREKAADAERASEDLRKAKAAQFRSFRDRPEEGELDRLVRREEMLTGLVGRLERLAADDAHVTTTAFASRDAAWQEIGASIEAAALRRVADPEPLDPKAHAAALTALRADLAKMRARASTRSRS